MINMNYFCRKCQFQCACISHICNLFCRICNIDLHNYKLLAKTFRGYLQIIFILFLLPLTDFRKENIRLIPDSEATVHRYSTIKVFLKRLQNSQENTFVGVTFQQICRSQTLNLYKRETPAQIYSCEFGAIFQKNSFTEHLLITAPADSSIPPAKSLSIDHTFQFFRIQLLIAIMGVCTKRAQK